MASFQKTEKTFSDLWTFSRASTAWYFDSAGVLQSVADNEPRITPDGLLLEYTSTNEITHSRDFTNAAWVKTNATAAMDQIGIDGVSNTACTVTDTSTSFSGSVRFDATVPDDANANTFSFFIKKEQADLGWAGFGVAYSVGGSSFGAFYYFNPFTGAAALRAGSATTQGNAVEEYGDWWRVTIALANNNTGNTVASLYIYPSFSSDGSSDDGTLQGSITIDQAQFELDKNTSTSPMLTSGSTFTRATEVCNGSSLNWHNNESFTIYGEFFNDSESARQNVAYYLSLSAFNAIDRAIFYSNYSDGELRNYLKVGGSTVQRVITNATSIKLALSYDAATGLASYGINGTKSTAQLSGETFDPTLLRLGTNYANQSDLRPYKFLTKRVEIWPYAMSEDELAEMTS